MSATYTLEATQFLRPNGARKSITCDMPIDTQEDYNAMRDAGARIEIEELMTGTISITIAFEDNDVDIRLAKNGPAVQLAIADMLKDRPWAQPKEAK